MYGANYSATLACKPLEQLQNFGAGTTVQAPVERKEIDENGASVQT